MIRLKTSCLLLGLSILAAALPPCRASAETLDLAGTWRFRLDPKDEGVAGKWFAGDLEGKIDLPGSLQERGFGDRVTLDTPWVGDIVDRSYFTSPRYAPYREPGRIKVPFWLQPEKYYAGAAWYQRVVNIPQAWSGKRITLTLERPHWQTTVWLDGAKVGSSDALGTPHVYTLPAGLGAGECRLTVRVDNRMIVNVGPNSHSVSDHTQSNWNGLVGRLQLAATDPVWFDDVEVYPNLEKRTARIVAAIGNATAGPVEGAIELAAVCGDHRAGPVTVPFEISGERGSVVAELPMGDQVRLWDEFQPSLYRLSARLAAGKLSDETIVRFGMREISTTGTVFVLLGRKIALRGTLDCCGYPLTGYPPTGLAAWKRIVRIAKAHGLNHIRFHSWCPPEAAFEAADELGFYYHVECSSWANQGASIGGGGPLDAWIYAEADRMLKAYGNHPSLLLMAYGNEPAGPRQGADYLGKWVTHYREKDPRRLYTSAAGWPILPENGYHSTPAPRIQQWGQGLASRINAKAPETITDYRDFVARYKVPVVAHEIGQWCVYPNFDEIEKYTGVLKPRNFEIFRDFLQAGGMGDQAHRFFMASGKLQAVCYKEEIESALRTPGFGGFQLLDLHDFPGQGTALVGVLDPFWDSKPYISPGEFRRFCGPTVPLARLPKRVFSGQDRLEAAIEVYHYGASDLPGAVVAWKVVDQSGRSIAAGRLPAKTIATGALTKVGSVTVALKSPEKAERMRLIVGVEGTEIENDWDLWAYPVPDAEKPAGVRIVSELNEEAVSALASGGRVLWLVPPGKVKSDVAMGFSSIFWNTAWTRNQPPHTLGILCDPAHPALAGFPTEYHSNWQWWELIHGGAAMVLDGLPVELRPIVQPIDTWFEARRLGLVFETRVGGGRLVVCSADLTTDLASRPVARQMRKSLLGYMAGSAFAPKVEVSLEALRGLATPPAKPN